MALFFTNLSNYLPLGLHKVQQPLFRRRVILDMRFKVMEANYLTLSKNWLQLAPPVKRRIGIAYLDSLGN